MVVENISLFTEMKKYFTPNQIGHKSTIRHNVAHFGKLAVIALTHITTPFDKPPKTFLHAQINHNRNERVL